MTLKVTWLWDTATGHLRRTLTGFHNSISALSFSPDGRTLAVGSYDKTVRCFDTRTWAVTRTFTGQSPMYSVAFSPDGRTLAIGDDGGGIWLTQTRTWAVRSLIGHNTAVTGLSFSPDGRTLASPTSELRRSSSGMSPPAARRALCRGSPRGLLPHRRSAASGDGNNQVRLWRAAPAARIAAWEKREGAAETQSAKTSGNFWTMPEHEQTQARALLARSSGVRSPATLVPTPPRTCSSHSPGSLPGASG